jgi:SRSO17 transposase
MRNTLMLYLARVISAKDARRYMEGLLLPSERHKTLTGLVNTEPIKGAQLPRAQALQWFLSEADWDERKMQESRLKLLCENPTTAPTSKGVLVIDETGDRKDGHKTAHVGRQYLGKLGKVDNGVVSVTSLWAGVAGLLPRRCRTLHPCSSRGRRARTIRPFGPNSRLHWNW